MNRFLAPTLFVVGGAAVIVACGGATSSDIVDPSSNAASAGDDGGTSITIDSGSAGKTDSGTISTDAGNGGGGGATDSGTGGGTGTCTIDASGVSTGCSSKEYCVSNDCKSGVCAPIPTAAPDNTFDAQCGCDNVNYWNAEVAHSYGQSVKSAGTCASALSCTTGKCSSGSYGCEMQQTVCGVSASSTTACWGVPPTCPEAAGATFVRSCNSGSTKCISQCDAFTAKSAYVLAANCN